VRQRTIAFWVLVVAVGVARPALSADDAPAYDAPAHDARGDEWWADSDSPQHVSGGYDDRDPPFEFALGVGYSRVTFEKSPDLIDNRDCIHFEPVLSVAPFERLPQFRIGGAVGWTAALDDTKGAIISNGGLVVATSSDVAFMVFEPELRLSWRQELGADGNFFIEPGAAAGAAIGYLDVNGRPEPGSTGDPDFSETDASFEWKVFLRAGLRVTGGIAGIEASYMRAERLHFTDDINGEPTEFYVGIFGALQF
jgi:hypothetical protein